MIDRKRWLAILQTASGSIATLLVAYGYYTFADPLNEALVQFDSIAENAELQITTTTELLGDIDQVAKSLQRALPAHRRSLESAEETAEALSATVSKWEQDIPAYQAMANDAARIANAFAGQLPITIPKVNLSANRFEYRLPRITPKTQEVSFNVPTASVEYATQSISYPSGASVKTKEKSIGPAKITYPSGIQVSNKSLGLKYPARIKIGSESKSITTPAAPEISYQDISFDIPKIELSEQKLMSDEKQLLEKSSRQLRQLDQTLEKTRGSLAQVTGLLSRDLVRSIGETNSNLAEAEKALLTFREDRIPMVVKNLAQQKSSLNDSRKLFAKVAEIIPIAFIIAGLLSIGVAFSGGVKLSENDTLHS